MCTCMYTYLCTCVHINTAVSISISLLMYMCILKVICSHQKLVFQFNSWALYGLPTFSICKFLVQQWEICCTLTPVHWLVRSPSSMIPISCLHLCRLYSPLLHSSLFPQWCQCCSITTGKGKEERRACNFEEACFNRQDFRQAYTTILKFGLGDWKTLWVFPWKLLRQMWLIFYIWSLRLSPVSLT